MKKEEIRKDILSQLSLLPSEEIQRLSFALTNQLVKLFHSLPDLSSEIGGGYLPLRAEIAPVYQELFRAVPMALAYPVLSGGQMLFGLPQGIPRGHTWLQESHKLIEPSWLFVPAVAFDLTGARLGRGKGYYDRYLEQHEVLTIGLAWSHQIIEKVPVESHDSFMDFIVTEKFCWDVDQQKRF